MGHEHSSVVIVGFVMDQDDFLMPFKTTTKEKFRMEERYDPKTGARIASRKVVDEPADTEYEFEGKRYEEANALTKAIEKKLDCVIESHGDMCSGEDMQYSIEPAGMSSLRGLTFADVKALAPQCKRLKKAFAKFGIELDEPGIFTLDSYG